MNPPILNRAGKLPDDGWYQIEAPGEHINHAAKVVQVIDPKAVDSIVSRFSAEATKGGENFAGMRIDKDHLSQSMANPTEALGWEMQLRNRDGMLEGKIDWTALGLPLIEAKPGQPPVYKFFSTEYDPAECEKIGSRVINKKTYAVIRPLRLDGLSLTNDPNNKGQRPISNRDGTSAGAAEETQPDNKMNRLLKALGLAEGASEDSAVAALQLITNRASTAEGQVVTITKERDTLLAAQVETDLAKYSNRFKPENREKIKSSLISNRAATIELLEATEAPAAASDKKPITNRGSAKTPEAGAAAEVGGEAKAKKISNRANELKATAPQRSFDSCWKQASDEIANA